MVVHVFTVLDKKSEVYGYPMCFQNAEVAKRQILDEIQKPNSFLGKYPEDFGLYRIASFDDAKGVVVPLDEPQLVCEISSLIVPVGK